MKVWKILQTLENLEDGMARLYDSLRRRHAGDAAAAGFFALMRDEELSHRDIVRYQQRVMLKTPEISLELADFDQAAVEQTMRTVENLIAQQGSLTLAEALRSSVAIEADAAEQHYRTVVGRASPALGRLVQNLGTFDKEHAAKLGAFAHSHGVEHILANA